MWTKYNLNFIKEFVLKPFRGEKLLKTISESVAAPVREECPECQKNSSHEKCAHLEKQKFSLDGLHKALFRHRKTAHERGHHQRRSD